jgi:hypothetical protein
LAAWQENTNNAKVVQLLSYQNGTWANPVTFSMDQMELVNPKIAVDPTGQVAAIVGEAHQNGNSFIFCAVRNAQGWGSCSVISGTDQNCSAPSVVINQSGQAYVIWVNGSVIRSAAFSNGSWELPISLSDTGVNCGTPALCMNDSGYAVVVWQADQGSTPFFQASVRPSSSSPWATASTISNN